MRATAVRWVAALLSAASLAAAGCAAPHAKHPSGVDRCPVPFNAGSRLPGLLNPAYPRSGLYPAPGGFPPAGAPGVTLAVVGLALVVTYGQPLEQAGVRLRSQVAQTRRVGAWWQADLAADHTFWVFGSSVTLFGVIPGPVITGARAAQARYVWLVTQWSAAQTLTLLRGTEALATAAKSWRLIPQGVTPSNQAAAAEHVKQALSAGWQPAGTFTATPACGRPADSLGPFGARAELKVPLGVPLQLIVPSIGSLVFQVTPR